MANFRRLSGRFHTLIRRLGDTVQNLASRGLSGRVDSTATVVILLFYVTKSFVFYIHIGPPPAPNSKNEGTIKSFVGSLFLFLHFYLAQLLPSSNSS